MTVQTLLVIVNRIFKCSRMPYTDRERKEIVEAIIRRQAHRILKVHFAQDLTLSTLSTTLSITLSTTLPKIEALKPQGQHNLEAAGEVEGVPWEPHMAEHEGAIPQGVFRSLLVVSFSTFCYAGDRSQDRELWSYEKGAAQVPQRIRHCFQPGNLFVDL